LRVTCRLEYRDPSSGPCRPVQAAAAAWPLMLPQTVGARTITQLHASTKQRRERVADEILKAADQRNRKAGEDRSDGMSQEGTNEARDGRKPAEPDGSKQQRRAKLAAWSLGDRPCGSSNASQ